MIEAQFRNWLQTQIDAPIFFVAIPQGQRGTCVTLQVTGKKRHYTQAKTSVITDTTFAVSTWTKTDSEIDGYLTVKTNAQTLETVLEQFPAVIGNYRVYDVTIENETDSQAVYLDGNNELVLGVTLTVAITHDANESYHIETITNTLKTTYAPVEPGSITFTSMTGGFPLDGYDTLELNDAVLYGANPFIGIAKIDYTTGVITWGEVVPLPTSFTIKYLVA